MIVQRQGFILITALESAAQIDGVQPGGMTFNTLKLTLLLGLCLSSLAYGYATEDSVPGVNDPKNRRTKAFNGKNSNGIPSSATSNQLSSYNGASTQEAGAPGTVFEKDMPFMLRIAKNNGEPGQTTVGRFLSVDDAYLRDFRNSATYRCNFHEGVHYAAIWEREPGQSPDTFYLRMKSNPRGIAEHRYLAVLEYPPYQNDRRDQDSLWLVVHNSKEEAIEWRAVGTDSRSIYLHAVRNHSKTGGWTTGFSVSARELLPVDKRDSHSTYAMVHSYMAAGLEIVQ